MGYSCLGKEKEALETNAAPLAFFDGISAEGSYIGVSLCRRVVVSSCRRVVFVYADTCKAPYLFNFFDTFGPRAPYD
jgi:hypothetical protein